MRVFANYLMLLLMSLSVGACGREYPPKEFLAKYEQVCGSSQVHGNFEFSVLPVSPDYHKAKWGAPLTKSSATVLFSQRWMGEMEHGNWLQVDPVFSALGTTTGIEQRRRKIEESIAGETLLIMPQGDTLKPIAVRLQHGGGVSVSTTAVISFAQPLGAGKHELLIRDYGHQKGNLRFELRACQKVRLLEGL